MHRFPFIVCCFSRFILRFYFLLSNGPLGYIHQYSPGMLHWPLHDSPRHGSANASVVFELQYHTTKYEHYFALSLEWFISITMTLWCAWWRLKSPASPLFTQTFIQAQIKENVKAPRHWPLCGEFTGDRWIPRTKASNAENVSIWRHHHQYQAFGHHVITCFIAQIQETSISVPSCDLGVRRNIVSKQPPELTTITMPIKFSGFIEGFCVR